MEWEPMRGLGCPQGLSDPDSFIKEPAASSAEETIVKIESNDAAINNMRQKVLQLESHSEQFRDIPCGNSTAEFEANAKEWPALKGIHLPQAPKDKSSLGKLEQPPHQQSHEESQTLPTLYAASQQAFDSLPTHKLQQLAPPEQRNEVSPRKENEKEQVPKESELGKEVTRQTSGELNGSNSPQRKSSSLRERLPFWSNVDAQECGFFFFATGAFLELEHAPNGQTWADFLAPVQPSLINGEDLIGPWQECMHASVVYENSHPKWQDDPQYGVSAPTQQVLEYFEACGHSDLSSKLEQAMKNSRKRLQSSGASGISSSRCSSRAVSPTASVMSSRHSRYEPTTMSRDSW